MRPRILKPVYKYKASTTGDSAGYQGPSGDFLPLLLFSTSLRLQTTKESAWENTLYCGIVYYLLITSHYVLTNYGKFTLGHLPGVTFNKLASLLLAKNSTSILPDCDIIVRLMSKSGPTRSFSANQVAAAALSCQKSQIVSRASYFSS